MINKVILVGNVGADPEIRTLETGTKVARVRLATTERIFNRQTQETKEHTEWHTVVLWRGLADVADKYVRKGSQIYVEGPLRSNEWTDKDGGKRYGVEIVANDLKLLGRRQEGSGGGSGPGYGSGSAFGGGNGGGNGGYGAPEASGASGAPGSAPRPAAAPDPVPADDPDDLPF
jgi:single-strand DNA-binding protein